MNRILFYIILLLALSFCKSHKNSNELIMQDSIKELPILANSLSFTQSEIEIKKLKLSFSKIDSLQFNKYKEGYMHKIKIDSTKNISENGGYFLLKTNKSNFKFVCGKNYSRPCYNYIGLLEPINSYIIGQFGESIYDTFLLDKENSSSLQLVSEFDGGIGVPLISPDNKKILTFSSTDSFGYKNYYDFRSYITLYDLNDIKNLDDIRHCSTYGDKEWELADLIWIDNKSFALQVFDERYYSIEKGKEILKNVRYLKAIIE